MDWNYHSNALRGVSIEPYEIIMLSKKIFLQVWADEQSRLLMETSDMPVSLAGDGRCDLPGYRAKYLSYTFTDATRDVILHIELVQVRVIACTCFLLKLLSTIAH